MHELVRLHGGAVSVSSRVGHGTTFTVSIPRGSAHLPAERIGADRTLRASTSTGATAYVAEASRWLPDDAERPLGRTSTTDGHGAASAILLADDNADMRDYVRRILEPRWQVEAVARRRRRAGRGRARRRRT